MEVNGQHHFQDILPLGKEPLVTFNQEADRASLSVGTPHRREKSPVLVKNQTIIPSMVKKKANLMQQ
jgi:hypothetical protein